MATTQDNRLDGRGSGWEGAGRELAGHSLLRLASGLRTRRRRPAGCSGTRAAGTPDFWSRATRRRSTTGSGPSARATTPILFSSATHIGPWATSTASRSGFSRPMARSLRLSRSSVGSRMPWKATRFWTRADYSEREYLETLDELPQRDVARKGLTGGLGVRGLLLLLRQRHGRVHREPDDRGGWAPREKIVEAFRPSACCRPW